MFEHVSGPADYMQQSQYNRTPTNPGLFNGPYLISGLRCWQPCGTGAQSVLARHKAVV